MKTFARVQDGIVIELFQTDQDVGTLFNPALVWIDLTNQPEVTEGWTYRDGHFAGPVPVGAPPPPSLSTLQAELQALSAKIQALTTS